LTKQQTPLGQTTTRNPTAEAAIEAEQLRALQLELRLLKARTDIERAELRLSEALTARDQAERRAIAAEGIDRQLGRLATHAAEIDALKRSHSWRVTAPMRVLTQIIRGQPGAALREAGMQQARVERLRCVAGQDGGPAKRLARLVLYGVQRAAARLFGEQSFGQAMMRLLPPASSSAAMIKAAPGSRYQAWIHEHESVSPAAPRGSPEPAVIAVLLALRPGEAEALDRTLASLAAQTRGAWQCLIAAPPEMILSAPWSDDGRIVAHPNMAGAVPEQRHWHSLAALPQAASAPFVLVLAPGDVLAATAMAALIDRFDAEPALDLLYADEDVLTNDGLRSDPTFKPSWSPELLQSYNYFGRPTVMRRDLVTRLGGLQPDLAEASEWDLNLRIAEATDQIGRITQVICHRNTPAALSRPTPNTPEAALFREVIRDHWARHGIEASIVTQADGTQRATWPLLDPPLVSIVIPNRRKPDLLRACLDGILRETTYSRREIIIIDLDSTDPNTIALYDEIVAAGGARIIPCLEPSNHSAARNAGARAANGSLLLFLDNDIKVTQPGWLTELVRYATRPGVGVVGTRLVYPRDEAQLSESVIGLHLCGQTFRSIGFDGWEVLGSSDTPRNLLGIMGACQMIDRALFERLGGFDESYASSDSSTAISLRAHEAGYRTVYTPFAQLAYNEGQAHEHTAPLQDIERVAADIRNFDLKDDPYFHPGLSCSHGVPTLRLAREICSETQAPRDATDPLVAYPAATKLDLLADEEVAALLGAKAGTILPIVMSAEAITDQASAALFCIALLRGDSTVRARFPRALSDGIKGDFIAWLRGEGRVALGLSNAALAATDRCFHAPPGARPRQILLMRPDLRATLPLATLPAGWGGLLLWLVGNGTQEYALQPEEIWWFLLECAEDPAREMRLLYLLTPAWQQMFPDATTRFGQGRFGQWLCAMFALKAPWADPASWPEQPVPGEQIRIAWQARPAWRRRFPEALEEMDQARALLSWLGDRSSGLPETLRAWCAALEPEATAKAICVRGVNVISHFCYPSGLRTSAQSIVDGLLLADWAVSLRDVPVDRRKDEPIHHHFVGSEHHDTTLVHIQPDPYFRDAYVLSGLHPRQPRSYRIGYWYWEMDTIPESWKLPALQTDELWAATRFVGDALKARFDQPVFTLPPGVALAPFQRRARDHFGVPSGKFAFLFVFHMMSIMERKNPLGLIRAFARAFGPDAPVVLVLKTTFGKNHPQLIEELHRAAAEAPAEVVIIDEIYTQDETLSLMDACDSYISLHRSEGLGLTMAEAMLLAKPVIATRFSGNLDFMSDTTSLLVDCKVVEIGRSVPPYEAHMRWAEPSEEHAARLMRRIFDDRDFAKALGQRARVDLEANLSPVAAGQRMVVRLEAIRAEQQRWKRAGLERPSFVGKCN
jgi:glycosyltransferase involved in cell wall biosynthesis